jgi:hypothetical protein
MAINHVGSSARVDFGDLAAFGTGLTALSIAQTWEMAAAPHATYCRGFNQWNGDYDSAFASGGKSDKNVYFLCCVTGGGTYYGFTTTDAPLIVGVNRVVIRVWGLGVSRDCDCWVNGVLCATTLTWNGAVSAIGDSALSVRIGYDGTADSLYAKFSEVAAWAEKIPDWVVAAYSKGISPIIYRERGLLYVPLGQAAPPIINLWGPGAGSCNTSAGFPTIYMVTANHPPVVGYGCGRHGLTTNTNLNEAIKGGVRVGALL